MSPNRKPFAGRVRRVVAGLVGATFALTLAAPPADAINVHVRRQLFGLHDSRLDSLTRAGAGSIRLWDTGVQWDDIETSPDVFDWTRLDKIVTAAQANNTQVTLVLGQTPAFYGRVGCLTSPNTPCNPATKMPPLAVWTNYVSEVMNRYKDFHGKRGIAAYQTWNEADPPLYWSGTPLELAQLNKVVWQQHLELDPAAKVISPSFITRYPGQLDYLERYAATKVDGTPVWKYDDAFGLSLYPLAQYRFRTGVPEDSMKRLRLARARLTKAHVPATLPIWNVEINYGLIGGSEHPPAVPIRSKRQAANVVRTYLLNAAAGIPHVFWYAYDLYPYNGGIIGNTVLTDPETGSHLTLAGHAYYLVQKWMKGTMVGPSKHARPCAHNRAGTYTCVVRDDKGVKRIYWNPRKRATVRLHKGSRSLQTVTGSIDKTVNGGQHIKVNFAPVLVRSKR